MESAAANQPQESLWAQVKSDRKIVPNPTLNRIGLQVVRATVAYGLYTTRSYSTPPQYRADVEKLRQDGIIILPNFLPQEEFDKLHREFFDIVENHQDKFMTLDSINLYQIAYVDKVREELVPHALTFLKNERLRAIFEGAEKNPWSVFFHLAGLECVTYGESGKPDPQISMHADTFYHTHKAWLYMEDVTPENGPLAVIRGTNRLTWNQIPYIYSHSTRQGDDESRRILPEELEKPGMEETLATCSKNTLVIANTHAYHRRTQGLPGKKRFAMHIMARARPFAR